MKPHGSGPHELALLLACAAGPERPAALEDGGTASVRAGDTYSENVIRDLKRVRSVTMKYHDIDAAYQDGYPRSVPQCLDNPPEGGMGLHYINSALVDDSLNVEHPEILVYAPTPGGKPKLGGESSTWCRCRSGTTRSRHASSTGL